jgi:benzoyl-CoA reductase/2-hydroxyglutaryl-CoA dehydratase subunit BcrC/BadD/HgdB
VKGFVLREGEGGLERALAILDMITKLPESLSDEEVESAADFVFPELRNTVLGLLELESGRDLEVFFFRKLLGIFREAQRAQAEGKKIVLIPFTSPPEILWAFDNIFPICTEVLSGLIVNICAGQGERFLDYAMGLGLPDSLCSANTIGMMSLLMGPTLRPDAIVNNSPGSCNPSAKIHAFIADYLDIPQFNWEKPTDESQRGRELYFQYLKRLVQELEEWTGEELAEERLRTVMERSYRAVELYHEYLELKKARPCPVPNIFNLTLLALREQMWGREEAVEVLQKMVDISKERLRKGEYEAPEELARVYMSAAHYFFDFYNYYTWMEKNGISILGDVAAIYFFPPMDLSSRESMLRVFSDIAFDHPMTRQMGASINSIRWLEDISWVIRDLGADACIFTGSHACKHFLGTVTFLRREMMKRDGVPTLILTGDIMDKRHMPMGMFQEEVQIFVDNVVKRNAQRRKKSAPVMQCDE